MKAPAIYMLASKPRGTLYIGVTSNIVQRIWQHREGLEGFTRRYGVKTLVWYEQHQTMTSAIGREKSMKKWRRAWKLELVERSNPQWRDLWPDIVGITPISVDPAQAGMHGAMTPDVKPQPVIPAQAGIHCQGSDMDSRVRGNDDGEEDGA